MAPQEVSASKFSTPSHPPSEELRLTRKTRNRRARGTIPCSHGETVNRFALLARVQEEFFWRGPEVQRRYRVFGLEAVYSLQQNHLIGRRAAHVA